MIKMVCYVENETVAGLHIRTAIEFNHHGEYEEDEKKKKQSESVEKESVLGKSTEFTVDRSNRYIVSIL